MNIREAKEKYKELFEGIGDATIKKLEDQGLSSLEDLLAVDPAELAKLLGSTVYKAKKIIGAAREALVRSEVLVETADVVEQFITSNVKRISTGSKSLDRILGGGVPTRSITTLVGQHATGKSQICYQLAANVVDSGEYVGWVETEAGTFSPSRIREICAGRNLSYDPRKLLVIRAENITDPAKQLLAYEAIWKKAVKESLPLRLLVVDSFNARIRAAYAGREMLSARSQETARHIGLLEIIAAERNCAIVLTSQVIGLPDVKLQFEAEKRYGVPLKPYGGEYFLHSSTYILFLWQKSSEVWEATVVDAPDLPRKSATFKITSKGIEDEE